MRAVGRVALAMLAIMCFGAIQSAGAGATTTIGTAHKFKYVQNTVSVGGGSSMFAAADCGSTFVAVSGGSLMTGQPAEPRMTGNFTIGIHQTWQSRGFNNGSGKNLTTVALCRPNTAKVQYVQRSFTLPASPAVASGQATCPAGQS